jgi:hypothetical protein
VVASLRKPEDWHGTAVWQSAYTSLPEMILMNMWGAHEVRFGNGGMKVAILNIVSPDKVTLNGKVI